MKQKFFQFSIAILAIYFTLSMLEKLYDFGIKNNYYVKYSYIQKKKIFADNLFIGPCVPNTTINPKILNQKSKQKSYNLGIYHTNYIENYLTLHLYLKHNKSPKRIFVYCSPECFDEKFNHLNSFRFLAYLEDKKVYETIKKHAPEVIERSKIPFLKYSFENLNISFDVITGLKHSVKSDKNSLESDGFLELKNFTFKASYPSNYYFKWDEKNEIYLTKMIDLCKNKNIEMILYESPVYIPFAKKQPNRNQILEKINALTKKKNIIFKHFGNEQFENEKSNFITTVNLSKKGVLEFNEELKKYLETK